MPVRRQQRQRKRRPRRRRKKVVFDAGKVFSPADAKRDLEFDLDRETALYRARKGQGGDRVPPPVPISDGGSGFSVPLRRWAV